jgi:redox-sensitive bicupin YhaK (pirin superfamily)
MITVRHSAERGSVNLGWLDSKHTFSFGGYHDPNHMGFGNLRVINEDRVEPGQGFATHPHKDMEIISYIITGALEHKDSMGNGSVMVSGDVQRMTAGTGVTHSEFNHSKDEQVYFLQIWIQPQQTDLEPGYEQKAFTAESKSDQLRLVASRNGRDGSLTIHQDVDLYAAVLSPGSALSHTFAATRNGWLQVIRGSVVLNDELLQAGDGAAIEDTPEVRLKANEDAELLLFDLAGTP